jgi:hypothetical protein
MFNFKQIRLNVNRLVFICFGRQTKQIMVATFQTLMLLIANAESSPLFCTFGFYSHISKYINNVLFAFVPMNSLILGGL